MREQYLDKMDLERERGITIKAQAVRLAYRFEGVDHELNLIDTPGPRRLHVRGLALAGRLRGRRAARRRRAGDRGADARELPPRPRRRAWSSSRCSTRSTCRRPTSTRRRRELAEVVGCPPEDVLAVSAKTGRGRDRAASRRSSAASRPRSANATRPLRALIFDSSFDPYRGVIAYLRVKRGRAALALEGRGSWRARSTRRPRRRASSRPRPPPCRSSRPGEVGYLVTGLKDVHQVKVGDTVTLAGKQGAREPLPGYREPKPMVWSGLFPAEGGDYSELREALDRLKLNDAALVYEPETSRALGFGFRCGFLGLLHMDIVKERLEREFGLELIATAPNVEFHVIRGDETIVVHNPSEMPQPGTYDRVEEPIVRATIITPSEYLGRRPRALPGAPRRAGRHAVPLARARRGPLQAPARRDHLRLLRPAEVQDPRVRLARLRADRVRGRRTWSGSTSCCTASPSTRSRASSTARRRRRTDGRWSSACAS